MKNTKFRFIYGQGPFFYLYRISLTTPVMIVTGLLGYEHILPVYFALAIPWMSSPSGRDSLTKAVLLPRANQSSVCVSVGNHPLFLGGFGCRSTCFPLGNHSLTPSASVTENIAYNQERPISAFLVVYPYEANLGVGVYGGNPTNRSLWCQWVESNHRPSAYEADVLTI